MTIYNILQDAGLPVAYSHFRKAQKPPYIVYIGDGQNTFSADNTYIDRHNTYQVEYYFTKKDEAAEQAIENLLLESGFFYEKSTDTYIEDEDVFVVYYAVWTYKELRDVSE